MSGLVCGFWDEADRLAGLGWRLGGEQGGVVLREGSVTAADGAEIAVAAEVAVAAADGAETADGEESLRLELSAGEERIEAELRPRGRSPANGDGVSTVACEATVRVAGRRRVVRCAGYATRWASDPLAGTGVLRHLALPAPDGGALVVLARGAAGADFSEEAARGWLFDSGGAASGYPSAYLSTQYDSEGRQTRAGVELWSEDPEAGPMRAAGTLLGEVAEPGAGGVSAAILRSSADGATGLGGYLIWRAP